MVANVIKIGVFANPKLLAHSGKNAGRMNLTARNVRKIDIVAIEPRKIDTERNDRLKQQRLRPSRLKLRSGSCRTLRRSRM